MERLTYEEQRKLALRNINLDLEYYKEYKHESDRQNLMSKISLAFLLDIITIEERREYVKKISQSKSSFGQL